MHQQAHDSIEYPGYPRAPQILNRSGAAEGGGRCDVSLVVVSIVVHSTGSNECAQRAARLVTQPPHREGTPMGYRLRETHCALGVVALG